ncbi:MAG: phosphate ABC transporter permease PstA [Planctomycetes bacterium]|nr:phosphate ABC transporter permease PstA [Planctomycetota bacterium]
MSQATLERPAKEPTRTRRWRTTRRATALSAYGEPWLWLASGALALALAMIAALVLLILVRGFGTFWPSELLRIERKGAPALLGEVTKEELVTRPAADGMPERTERRRMLRTGNYDLTGHHFEWVWDSEVEREARPEWALAVERTAWGRFHGEPVALVAGERVLAEQPSEILARLDDELARAIEGREARHRLEVEEVGAVHHAMEVERLTLRHLEAEGGDAAQRAASIERTAELERQYEALQRRLAELDVENGRTVLRMRAPDGATKDLALVDVVRAYPANALDWSAKLGVYLSRWWEFLTDVPREANSEGGVFPAIFGTVVMTLIMSLVVVPFGVLAALYLREYAKAGALVSIVRICVNNLAGVPSIVFGVFGLGFFCMILGTSIDELLFADRLPNPTYGKGGLLWASLTLALLTLPVVIVATEEAIAAVPNSMREGSYGCGATKGQTILRIVLPRALPGIMTGMILAIARGAGEVAPLMLVGAVKLAPQLAVDGTAPFVHPERSFLHLGFHVFDLGFQSQNSEAAKPMVYTTTLLLIGIVVTLNLTAIWIRSQLRKKYAANPF